MLKYILRRLLIMLPTLFVILLISFIISRNVPGDHVEIEIDFNTRPGVLVTRASHLKAYKDQSHQFGLDLPEFYFSLQQSAYPDTLYRIIRLPERENLAALIDQFGNWEAIENYYQSVCIADEKADAYQAATEDKLLINDAKLALYELRTISAFQEIQYRFDRIDEIRKENPAFDREIGKDFESVKSNYAFVRANPQTWKLYIPSLRFYGWNNQFHQWLSKLLRLDFGRSLMDRRPVIDKIADALPWSLFMGFFSSIASFLVAIPIGVWSVRNRNKWQDRAMTIGIFLLHSVPSFVAAMFLMTFLCNPEYLYIFPTTGVSSDSASTWSYFDRLKDYAWHLTLPTLTFTYGSIAMLSRQMRVGMLETINMDFIRTARAKGLSETTVYWKHAMRNSVMPLLTSFSNFLPHLIGGAVIIETIFSVPGMGRLMIRAVYAYDYPVLLAVFTLAAIATLVGILLTDIFYTLVDPRISFTKKE